LISIFNEEINSPITQAIFLAVVTFEYFYIFMRKKKLPPGPLCLPFLGNILHLLTQKFEDVVNGTEKKYGRIFTLSLLNRKLIFINDIDILNEALVKNGSAASGRPFVHSMHSVTDGGKDIFMTSYGENWKIQRKV